MSNVLHYPDAIEAPELQVWNNAAFDNEDSDGRWSSCLEPDPAFVNRSSDSGYGDKENFSPGISVKAPKIAPAKPLRSILNCPPRPQRLGDEDLEEEEKKIVSEIEAIEREIGRLSSRLEVLRIERKSKAAERRKRISAAKKKSVFVEAPPRSVDRRRGMSLGPAEILSGSAGMRRMSKLEVTPIQAAQSRRKSCFWKLEEIDELRATKERGKSQSLSPRSRKTAMKTQPTKQSAATTAKKSTAVLGLGSMASMIQPKKLFVGENSAKKPAATRPGRVVASRYNSSAARTSGEARKRSLPEEEEEDVKRTEKKRISSAVAAAGKSRGKKKWEIPTEVVIFRGSSEEEDMAAALPNIRTLRWRLEESPGRDSGPAKRVSELAGRRSYFFPEEEGSVCQVLCFGDGEEVLKGN